ncbi:MAG: thiamine phosphate synthase [Muribaculaceae bacterium]|nr:thiamine phosphate synthase [Muribaculaceae bacterium]
MLQYTIVKSPLLSDVDQAKMAIDAGCEWIELDTAGANDDEIEKTAVKIIPLCREAGVILVFKHHDILVDKLRVHGISLSRGDKEALELRERMGGHVIIGVEYSSDINWLALKRADADYLIIDSPTPDVISQIKNESFKAGLDIPLVAAGRLSTTEIASLWKAGASGFNIDINSLKGPEYTVSLKQIINFCQDLRG